LLGNFFPLQAEVRSDSSALLIIDVADMPYIDSAGIGCLVGAHVSREHSGRKLIIAGANERLLTSLKVTKVDQLFTFAPTVEQARAQASGAWSPAYLAQSSRICSAKVQPLIAFCPAGRVDVRHSSASIANTDGSRAAPRATFGIRRFVYVYRSKHSATAQSRSGICQQAAQDVHRRKVGGGGLGENLPQL